VVHGPLGDEQPLRDLPVRQSLREQRQDPLLAGGEPGRGALGRRAGPAGIAVIPSARISCRASWPVAAASRPVRIASASRKPDSAAASYMARAASYGQLRLANSWAAPCHSPAICNR
jgi:hypothetical protein